MGNFLDENISTQIKEVFSNLANPVDILVFTSEKNCEYCEDTRFLLEEVCGLSEKLHFQAISIEADAKMAKQYHIDRTPAVAVWGWWMANKRITVSGFRNSRGS